MIFNLGIFFVQFFEIDFESSNLSGQVCMAAVQIIPWAVGHFISLVG